MEPKFALHEDQLHKELVQRLRIIRAYEWRQLSATREQHFMRKRLDSLPPDECYLHCDFAENIGVPLSNKPPNF